MHNTLENNSLFSNASVQCSMSGVKQPPQTPAQMTPQQYQEIMQSGFKVNPNIQNQPVSPYHATPNRQEYQQNQAQTAQAAQVFNSAQRLVQQGQQTAQMQQSQQLQQLPQLQQPQQFPMATPAKTVIPDGPRQTNYQTPQQFTSPAYSQASQFQTPAQNNRPQLTSPYNNPLLSTRK